MNFTFTVRGLSAWATPLLVAGLAGCGHSPETATATTAPAAATPLAPAPAATPAAVVATPIAKALPVKGVPKLKPIKLAPLARPVAAMPAAPVPEVAPAPEPIAAASAAPATHTQAGRVLDESGQPLVGATVMLRGSTKGTSTDANGSYTLEVPNGENTFVIGYGGYEDETASSRDGQPLNITLLPSPSSKTKGRRGRR